MFWSLLSLLAMSQTNANELKINYELRLNGKQICSGTQIVETGRATELCTRDYNQGRLRFRVKINPGADRPGKTPTYLVSGYLAEHDKDGMPVSFSNPQILSLENERAEIATADENDAEVLGFAAQVFQIH